MLATNLEKIDKFLVTLVVILILMAVLLIFTFRGIFSSFLSAYEISDSEVSTEYKIDKDKLNEAYDWVYQKEVISLEFR